MSIACSVFTLHTQQDKSFYLNFSFFSLYLFLIILNPWHINILYPKYLSFA